MSEFQSIDDKYNENYKQAIIHYNEALSKLELAIELFENTPWGIPGELNQIFNNENGNENLSTLQKEADYLSEIQDEHSDDDNL
jgi:hypothetical protein